MWQWIDLFLPLLPNDKKKTLGLRSIFQGHTKIALLKTGRFLFLYLLRVTLKGKYKELFPYLIHVNLEFSEFTTLW